MDEYRTSDLYFAAYLITAKCVLKRTDKVDRRVFFIFDKAPFLEELNREYFNGQAKVSAQPYAAQIKNLKALTHNLLNSS